MKRKIAILLVLALVLSFIPAIVVHAAETTTTTATITFDDTSKRKTSTTSQQVWEEDGITVTYDKAGYNSDLAEYLNPIRFYAKTQVTVAHPGMTQIVFNCSASKYATVLQTSIGAAATVSGNAVTVQFADPVDSFLVTLSAQARVSSVVITAVPASTDSTEAPTEEPTQEPTTAPTEPAPTEPAPTEPAAPAGPSYNKITSMDQLTTGKYVMVVDTGYAPQTLSGSWLLSGKPTINGDTITNDNATDYVWEITVNGTTATLKDSNGAFIKPPSGNSNSIAQGTYDWAVSCTDGTFQFKGTGSDTTTLCSNKGADNKFRAYKNDTVTGNPNGYPSYFTLYKLAEETEEPSKSLVGTSYSIRMMEPWALRTNIRFFSGTVESPTLVPLADIASYGAYAIIEHKFDNAETATVADLIADSDTKAYTSADGSIAPGGADTATTVVFDFTDEIYTYRLDEKVYWVAYYEDAEGQIHYTDIKSTTIITVANTVGGQTNVSDEEKAVLASMKVLKQAVIDFRGADADLGGTTYPAGVALGNSGISFNQNGAAGTYKFGTSHQIRLIEPWSIRVQMSLYDVNTQKIDCATTDVNYGMIFYHAKGSAYADGMSVEQMLAEGDALVYSTQTNNIEIVGDSAVVVYDKGIYTYELDTKLYCLPYVEANGQYYYRGEVICWNLLDQMETFSQNSELSAAEIAVFEAMIDLHEKTLAYRNK